MAKRKKMTQKEREKAYDDSLREEIKQMKKAGLPPISLKALKERRKRFQDRMQSASWVIVDDLEGEELEKYKERSHAWSEAMKGNYEPGIKLGLFPKDAQKRADRRKKKSKK